MKEGEEIERGDGVCSLKKKEKRREASEAAGRWAWRKSRSHQKTITDKKQIEMSRQSSIFFFSIVSCKKKKSDLTKNDHMILKLN